QRAGGVDEDPEGLLPGDGGEQLRVEGVDALHEQHARRVQAQLLAAVRGALARHEVEAGGAHRLAREEASDVIVQELEIESLEGLEVVVAVGASRGSLTIA